MIVRHGFGPNCFSKMIILLVQNDGSVVDLLVFPLQVNEILLFLQKQKILSVKPFR